MSFHMTNIIQLGFIYISQSNCLVTVEIEMGSVPVNRRGVPTPIGELSR
jgi:hypothetical protein